MRERKHAVAETAMKQIIRKKGIASYVSPIKQQNRRGGGEEGFSFAFPLLPLVEEGAVEVAAEQTGGRPPRVRQKYFQIFTVQ